MANEEMWDRLFKRVDSFKAELKPTKADTKDALVLAEHAVYIGFVSAAVARPRNARKLKDVLVGSFRQAGLSRKRLQKISDELTEYCVSAEKKQ